LAVESTRLGLDVLDEPAALSAPRHGPPALGQRREGDLEEVVHALDVLDEVVELELEHLQRVLQNGPEVGLAEGDQIELKRKKINKRSFFCQELKIALKT
jgi:hypothetical protein